MKITGEMQVHILHRNDLRVAATGRAALHPETWPERCLADTDRCLLADGVQPVDQPDCCGGFAFTGRGRVDGCDKDQLAIFAIGLRGNEFCRHYGISMP